MAIQPNDRIRATLTALRDALAGAGVPATLDPAQLVPPGAWIRANWLDYMTMSGAGRLVTDVYLVAPAVGTIEALDILSGLYDAALTVVEPSTEEGDRIEMAQAVTLPANPATPLPAFRLITHLFLEGPA